MMPFSHKLDIFAITIARYHRSWLKLVIPYYSSKNDELTSIGLSFTRIFKQPDKKKKIIFILCILHVAIIHAISHCRFYYSF